MPQPAAAFFCLYFVSSPFDRPAAITLIGFKGQQFKKPR
ncbi:hypothetical protein F385_1425 [Pantoea agglomerans 299R]|nr:hypothetical protein F385_1425 [Pantoea agglomerans 299R]